MPIVFILLSIANLLIANEAADEGKYYTAFSISPIVLAFAFLSILSMKGVI